MDFSKFKTSDWLKVGGGGVFLIASFLKWWGVDTDACDGDPICERIAGDIGANGWEFFFTGIVPTLLLVAIAVLTFLAVTGTFHLPKSLPAPLVFLGAAGLSTLLVLMRFLNAPGDSDFNEGITRKLGLYLALLAAIVVLVGCVLGFKESGGDLNDLTNVDKLKGAFNQGGGATPPPPPGMTPPPPPPPPPGGTPPPPPPPAG